MTSGFQQQNPWATFSPPRSDAQPQHGQKADKACLPTKPPRAKPVRPGH